MDKKLMMKRLGFAGSVICLLILSIISTVMKTQSKDDASGSNICSIIQIPFLHDLLMNICFETLIPISIPLTNSTDDSDYGGVQENDFNTRYIVIQ